MQEPTSVTLRSSGHASSPQEAPETRTETVTDGSSKPEVIGRLLESHAVTDLDYEIFVLDTSNFVFRNSVMLPKDKTAKPSFVYPSTIAREVTEGPILAATGTTGVVQVGNYTCYPESCARLGRFRIIKPSFFNFAEHC